MEKTGLKGLYISTYLYIREITLKYDYATLRIAIL